jgi:reverse gyrase
MISRNTFRGMRIAATRKLQFDVNKIFELAHDFFGSELIRTSNNERDRNQKEGLPMAKRAVKRKVKKAPARRAATKKPAARKTARKSVRKTARKAAKKTRRAA